MKIVILILFTIGMLTTSDELLAQEANRFTFPANGAIFQQDASGNYTVRLGGQVDNTHTWYIRIRKRTADNTWVSINCDQREILTTSISGSNHRHFYV